ncbi:MAG: hypothetical protein ACP59X_02710 [Solidesulfovibrio sp. DCME]|uniref:hypothetical protein n=1 Tax=Solidesulfovibrio sp. DCME TaxID=3447380 RepID=UPI003D0CFF39
MSKSRKALFATAGLTCLALLAMGCYFAAFSPQTFRGPGDLYLLRYPRSWQATDTAGLVTFTPKDRLPGAAVSVTIVIAKAAAGWVDGFEKALSDAFGALGSDYRFLRQETVRLPGGEANTYAYTVVLDGTRRDNLVYVFEIGAQKAAVMTCSAPPGQEADLAKTCRDFAATFRSPAP